MDGTAVKEIERLAQEAAGEGVVVTAADAAGKVDLYSTIQLHRLPKEQQPDEPSPLGVHSLQGLVDYLAANRDELKGADCMIHVVSPTLVRVVSRLQPRAKRFAYLEAEALDLVSGFLDHFHQIEVMVIALQARFTRAGARDEVLKLLGNVTDDAEVRVEDDGVTQKVKTRAGIVLKDESPVPNPVRLAPYRTFREVAQPVSPFILRLRRGGEEGPKVALFESDGGAWELQAVENIATWLDGKVGDFAILH